MVGRQESLGYRQLQPCPPVFSPALIHHRRFVLLSLHFYGLWDCPFKAHLVLTKQSSELTPVVSCYVRRFPAPAIQLQPFLCCPGVSALNVISDVLIGGCKGFMAWFCFSPLWAL